MTTRDEMSVGSSKQPPSTYPKGKTYLFFIAIDEYQNGIRPLNNAVRDAEAIKDCLINQYEFDLSNLVFLKNDKATQKAITDQFDRYTELITEEDNLLFYFSGHGYFHKNNKKGYWLTFESVTKNKNTFLGNDEIISYIKNINARHIFGIVDACFSEALFNTRNHRPQQSRRYSLPSRWLLTAGRLEPVSDGPIGKHSPFAESLLNYLKHYEGNRLWVSELCNEVVKYVEFNSGKQTPRGEPLPNVGHGGGEFLFWREGQTLPKTEDNVTEFQQIPISRLNQSKEKIIVQNSSSTSISKLRDNLINQLTENEWKSVFIQLDNIIKKGRKKIILRQMKGVYNQILDKKMSGSISQNKISRNFNELRMSLLGFIEDLKAEDLS